MTNKLNDALEKVETSYAELVNIANEMLSPVFKPINELIDNLKDRINNLTVDDIRDNILNIQLKAYEISEMKDRSAMKAELAEAIQKEKMAVEFNRFDGSAAAKEKLALVETSGEIVADALYTLVANLLKTKLDSLYRMIDSLKSVLSSRMQEIKFMNLSTSSEIPATTNGRITLNE